MLGLLTRFTGPMLAYAAEAATGYFMQNANPAAKAYAQKVAGEEAKGMVQVAATGAELGALACGAPVGLGLLVGLPQVASDVKRAAYTPWRWRHEAANVGFLNGVSKDDGSEPQLGESCDGFINIRPF